MTYAVLVVSALFFEFALNLPIGSMPLALTADGAPEAVVAITMGCGMFSALLAAVPLGGLADRIGRLPMIRAAAFTGVVTTAGLGIVHGAVPVGVLLAIRSVAVVAYMTAEFAYASSLASKDRAVSDVATLGMIGNLTFATAPAFGVFLWQHGVGRVQYEWAALASLAGALLLFALPARHDVRSKRTRRMPAVHPRWFPSMGYVLAATLQGGVNGSLAVLTFANRGIVNGAIIFTASAIAAFALRYPAGRLVDRFGARALAVPVTLLQGAGCVLAANAHALTPVIVAGVFQGVAWAAVVPIGLGLLFEHGSERTRGAAMGAYNLAFNSGAALGAILATVATLAGGGYTLAMEICALVPLLVLPTVLRSGRDTRALAAARARTRTVAAAQP